MLSSHLPGKLGVSHFVDRIKRGLNGGVGWHLTRFKAALEFTPRL